MRVDAHQSIVARVKPGISADIPSRAEVAVGPGTSRILGIGLRSRWCEMLVNGDSFPVHVRRSHSTEDTDDGGTALVRVPLIVRMMSGAERETTVTLVPVGRRRPGEWWSDLKGRVRWPDSWPQPNRAVSLLVSLIGLIFHVVRLVHYLVDLVLRVLLGAPTYCFVSEMGLPGDDSQDVIRIHPAAFSALGVAPGGQVVLTWRGRSTLVRVVEHLEGTMMESYVDAIRGVGSVHNVEDDVPTLPGALVMHVGTRVRSQLGMPEHTVVEARRSVTSTVSKHLSSLVIPLTAAVISVVGLPDSRYRWWIAVGVAVTGVVLALASLRIPKRTLGRWP